MKLLKTIAYVFYLLLAVSILGEIILRVYNPFTSGIKGDKIVLRVNTTLQYENDSIPVIDKHIIHTQNALGFRGPDTPANWNKYYKIFTVGGSTTECTYLSDTQTWTYKLAEQLKADAPFVWMNNAGISGHSTFGHKILLEDYLVKLHPDMILFLIGCNDIGRDDLIEKSVMKDDYGSVWAFFTKNSLFANVISNTLFSKRAKSKTLKDRYVNLTKNTNDTITYSATEMQAELDKHKRLYLKDYEKRTEDLLNICFINNIKPVLITQPTLFGYGLDPVTGVNLENRKVDLLQYNGRLWYLLLELYNDITRKVAAQHHIPLIDLAAKMPHSSLYFYDMIHFTNHGTDKVAEVIYTELKGLGKSVYR